MEQDMESASVLRLSGLVTKRERERDKGEPRQSSQSLGLTLSRPKLDMSVSILNCGWNKLAQMQWLKTT